MERDKNHEPYGLALLGWSIQWGVVICFLLLGVSYLIQFLIQGKITWAPLSSIGIIVGIALLLFLAEQAISGNFFKKHDWLFHYSIITMTKKE